MSSLLSLLRAGDELLSRVVRAICVVAMASIFIMFILNVFVRFVPIYNFTQTDDWTSRRRTTGFSSRSSG